VEMMITFTQHLRFSPIFSEVQTLNVRVTRVGVELMITFTQHPDNTIFKGQTDEQWSTQHYAQNKIFSNMNLTKNRRETQVLRKSNHRFVLSVLPFTTVNYPSVL
jgi:hypothetical protein